MPDISQAVHGGKGRINVSADGGATFIAAGEVANMSLRRRANPMVVTNRKTSPDSNNVVWDESKPSTNAWSASADINYVHSDAAMTLMSQAFQNQTILYYQFVPETGSGYAEWKGYAMIDIDTDMPITSQILARIALTGTGPLEEDTQ